MTQPQTLWGEGWNGEGLAAAPVRGAPLGQEAAPQLPRAVIPFDHSFCSPEPGDQVITPAFLKASCQGTPRRYSPGSLVQNAESGPHPEPCWVGLRYVGSQKTLLSRAPSPTVPEEVPQHPHIWECAPPASRVPCLPGRARVLYFTALGSHPQWTVLCSHLGKLAWALKVALCALRRAGRGGSPWRLSEREGRGRMTARELDGGRAGRTLSLGPSTGIRANRTNACRIVVKSRNLCYTGCAEGRQGPTKPHV